MPPVKPEARVAAIYEITRTSRIYAAPTEFSARIGDIEPGMKVSVVNGRDGWLEVRSKHGRGRRVSFAGRCRVSPARTDQPSRIATPASIP
jgi:putative component of toxin-antitoxin plasmid stabilization module